MTTDVEKAAEHLRAARELQPEGSLPLSDSTILQVVNRHNGWKRFQERVVRRELARNPRQSNSALSRKFNTDRRTIAAIRENFLADLAWRRRLPKRSGGYA